MRYAGLLLTFLLISAATFVRPVAATSDVATAQARHAHINRNLRTYQRVQRELPGYSTEGGLLDVYAAASVPRKIVATYYGETGRATEEYYFWNGSLFFVLRAESRYDGVFGPIKVRSEQRFYFNNGRLIRWINDRKMENVESAEARMRRHEVLATTREMLDKAKAALRK